MFYSVLQKHTHFLACLTILILMSVSISVLAVEENANIDEASKVEIQWTDTVEEAKEQSKKTGKPIMMDFYTEW